MSKALDTIARLRTSMARAKEQVEDTAGRAVNGAITVGCGYAIGMGIHKFGENGEWKLPGTEIDVGLAAGVVALAAGISGLGGKYSDPLTSAGSGLLAGQLAISTYRDGKL